MRQFQHIVCTSCRNIVWFRHSDQRYRPTSSLFAHGCSLLLQHHPGFVHDDYLQVSACGWLFAG